MAKVKQVSSTVDKQWAIDFEVVAYEHTPSWKKYGEGTAMFKAMRHKDAGWVSLTMSETSLRPSAVPGQSNTIASTKETMLTLTPESARELWLFLGRQYGGAA